MPNEKSLNISLFSDYVVFFFCDIITITGRRWHLFASNNFLSSGHRQFLITYSTMYVFSLKGHRHLCYCYCIFFALYPPIYLVSTKLNFKYIPFSQLYFNDYIFFKIFFLPSLCYIWWKPHKYCIKIGQNQAYRKIPIDFFMLKSISVEKKY